MCRGSGGPEKPHLATVSLLGLPKVSAPPVCQLCGAGFRDWRTLVGHADRQHGGFKTYRSRQMPCSWFAGRAEAKRETNAATAMVYSRPRGEGEFEVRKE